jgi:hypothetical protein
LVFACALGLLVAVTATVWWLHPHIGYDRAIAEARRPPDDHYLALDQGGHVDHHVLYFGTDDRAVAHLRRADVLLLGNSRLMFAARPGVLDPFFARIGLRYYALGFGFREADLFPLAIIERFDLRPRLVVVNADGFFTGSLSDFAGDVTRDTAFEAWQALHEAEVGHEVRRVVHQLVPNWVDLFGRPGFPRQRELIVYRSRRNGTWQISPWSIGTTRIGVRDLTRPGVSPAELRAARYFKRALDRRGIRLALTYVPTPPAGSASPLGLAAALGVPFVAVEQSGLLTNDGDHLDEASAVAWSERFAEQLVPFVR